MPLSNSYRCSALCAATVVALALSASPAAASVISYQIRNHPDGGKIDSGVDEDGYVLRLDLRMLLVTEK